MAKKTQPEKKAEEKKSWSFTQIVVALIIVAVIANILGYIVYLIAPQGI